MYEKVSIRVLVLTERMGWGGKGGGREGENETYTKSKPSDAAHSLLAFTPGTVTTGSAPDLCVDLHSVQNIRFRV